MSVGPPRAKGTWWSRSRRESASQPSIDAAVVADRERPPLVDVDVARARVIALTSTPWVTIRRR